MKDTTSEDFICTEHKHVSI